MSENKFDVLRTPNYSEFIHKSRYARWLELEGRREDWDETIHRYVTYFKNKLELDDEISKEITEYITNFKVMPSMRALMSAGIALEKDQVAGYNCSYVAINDVKTFDEIMYILMCGTGVGFSVERQYIAQLPELADKLYPTNTTIIPEDSKIGWATAYRELFSLLYSGKIPKWDLSKIRPAGSKLKTFGGRASGPDPLEDLFNFTVGVFKNASGKRLTSIECHDLVCKIASIVIAGGVRRSALISLSNLSDDRMRTAKSGAWWNDNTQRALANNSVCYTEKPSMDSFIKEWLSLYESKSGERGIYNRDAAIKLMPQRRKDLGTADVGCNPCRPGKSTLLLKIDLGSKIIRMDEVKAGDFVWSREGWTEVLEVFNNGIQEVNSYKTNAGSIHLTAQHKVEHKGKKVEVQNAKGLDCLQGINTCTIKIDPQDVMDGLVIGDGTRVGEHSMLCIGAKDHDYFNSEVGKLIGNSYSCGILHNISTTITPEELTHTYEREIPDRFKYACQEKIAGFLRGVFSANGSVLFNNASKLVQLKQSSYALISDVQIMLSALGIPSYICTNKATAVKHYNGTYISKVSYNLRISAKSVTKFENIIGFIHEYKSEKLASMTDYIAEHAIHYNRNPKSTYDITEVKSIGDLVVYDIAVDNKSHTYWADGFSISNCSEITLRDAEFCNLTEVIVREGDSLNDLRKKVRLASILGTIQSTITDFRYLRKEWKINCEEERLLGVSLTGIMDHPVLNGEAWLNTGDTTIEKWLDVLKDLAIKTNIDWAKKLNIEPSAAISCIKPSGTVSQLTDTSSGIHPRYSKYYIRTVRADKKDPLAIMMKDLGVPVEDDVMSPTNLVFSFPIESPDSAIFRDDRTAIEQLEIWKLYQLRWCEHKPSITVYVKESEWLEVAAWVYKYFDVMSGVSFLPHTDHSYQQAPYQEIDKEKYEELKASEVVIDWELLKKYELTDETVNTKELACTAGACEI